MCFICVGFDTHIPLFCYQQSICHLEHWQHLGLASCWTHMTGKSWHTPSSQRTEFIVFCSITSKKRIEKIYTPWNFFPSIVKNHLIPFFLAWMQHKSLKMHFICAWKSLWLLGTKHSCVLGYFCISLVAWLISCCEYCSLVLIFMKPRFCQALDLFLKHCQKIPKVKMTVIWEWQHAQSIVVPSIIK